jgi:hypothetical protein
MFREARMAKATRSRASGARSKLRVKDVPPVDSGVLRELALELPNVEDGTTERGIAFKIGGRLLVCEATHASAEPNSLVVRVSPQQRERLMAAHPEALYLTDHYVKHPAVLARLARLDRESLRAILGAAWLYMAEKALPKKRKSSRNARG